MACKLLSLESPAVTGLTLMLLLVVVSQDVSHSFEYVSYCDNVCRWGKGGNLCKCTAGHFVGKRNLPYDTLTRESRIRDLLPEVKMPKEDASLGESSMEERVNSEIPFFAIKRRRFSKRQFNSGEYDHSEEKLFEQ